MRAQGGRDEELASRPLAHRTRGKKDEKTVQHPRDRIWSCTGQNTGPPALFIFEVVKIREIVDNEENTNLAIFFKGGRVCVLFHSTFSAC